MGEADTDIEILHLLAYTLAAAGLLLPFLAFRDSRDPVLRATGRHLRALALAGIIPSLQVLLDGIGFIGGLPGSWPTIIHLAMNSLTMAGLGLASITWSGMNRSFSPAPYFTDRFGSVPVILVLVIMAANMALQIAAEFGGSETATLAAGWGILAYIAVLASLIVISAVRLFRPLTVSSARRGVLLVKSLPLVPLVLTPLSVILPGEWPAALGPLALLALLVMSLIIFMRQTGDSGKTDTARQALFDESGLTAREREIALMLAEGLSYKEISTTLFVSLSTIQTHVARIYGKMGVNSKTELSRRIAGQ